MLAGVVWKRVAPFICSQGHTVGEEKPVQQLPGLAWHRSRGFTMGLEPGQTQRNFATLRLCGGVCPARALRPCGY